MRSVMSAHAACTIFVLLLMALFDDGQEWFRRVSISCKHYCCRYFVVVVGESSLLGTDPRPT